MPFIVSVVNNSNVWIENADMVVKEPRKPIIKKKYIGDDLLAGIYTAIIIIILTSYGFV